MTEARSSEREPDRLAAVSGRADRDIPLARALKLLIRSWYGSDIFRAERRLRFGHSSLSRYCLGVHSIPRRLLLTAQHKARGELAARIAELEKRKLRQAAKIDA